MINAFRSAALIRRRRLLEDGAYSDLSVNGAELIIGRHLFEARLLLEKIQKIRLMRILCVHSS